MVRPDRRRKAGRRAGALADEKCAAHGYDMAAASGVRPRCRRRADGRLRRTSGIDHDANQVPWNVTVGSQPSTRGVGGVGAQENRPRAGRKIAASTSTYWPLQSKPACAKGEFDELRDGVRLSGADGENRRLFPCCSHQPHGADVAGA